MIENRIFNFSAGPAVLPEDVLLQVRDNLLNYKNCGLGMMEMSHRGKEFTEIIQDTEATLRKLLSISDDYAVIFTTGGATNQFSMVAMNLLGGATGNYINTGVWSKKAIAEAKKFGEVHVAASSEGDSFSSIPTNIDLSNNAAYLHFTSNNTIFGTQFSAEPQAGSTPLICDASSDFLHKPLDVSKYGLIYAGAQKNLGPSGVTLVVIRKDLLERIPENLPIMMDYRTYVDGESLYNTPPTLPIYVVGEVLKWIDAQGGLVEMEKRNRNKAAVLYQAIDAGDFYRGTAQKGSRSVMNVTFRLASENLESLFLEKAKAAGFSGLKGHRSVGGIRASVYNAFPSQGVDALVEFMKEFESSNG
ncbi:MAG: 3-phosphoserine/phosphohydroxythreonine transaminase [Bdellovibrionales bacterium]|nr:3-phosphoserine/phosphohydroxythreonine transaminase [Bdellovibrionales bacterium]